MADRRRVYMCSLLYNASFLSYRGDTSSALKYLEEVAEYSEDETNFNQSDEKDTDYDAYESNRW